MKKITNNDLMDKLNTIEIKVEKNILNLNWIKLLLFASFIYTTIVLNLK